ncbi:BTAD domain-containing putative transcriptional regulator [Streptomyces sp. NPDC093225]|uniref:AfsR/SARP family transcriptional regulator n=1 Tax=Streptomyces sp. NPDC093225 TaxID=3366034 RepID=UPI0038144466
MQFKVLGPIEVEAGGRVVTPQPEKLRCLLALLCVKSGTVVSRQSLTHALWAGDPPRTARTALQVYVSKLRKFLDEHGDLAGRLVTKPHGYVFELEPERLDLRGFDALCEGGPYRGAPAGAGPVPEPEEELRRLSRACALWRGPALADLRGLPAFAALGRALDEKRLGALERGFDLRLGLGRHQAAIADLYEVVDEHPMWEAVHAQLMLALYRSGRVPEALEAYRRIHTTLVAELGMEPGDPIRLLHRSILRRDPVLDVPPAGPAAGPAGIARQAAAVAAASRSAIPVVIASA